MGIFWLTNIMIVLVEAVFLVIILYFYIGVMRRAGGKFVAPMIAFSSLFLMQSILSAYFYYDFSHFAGYRIAVPLIAVNGVGLASFIMLFLSIKQ
ncbi:MULTISPECIES: hypothetical protein [unclassified Thermoplasma]|uniref:hypothetical protein n=1 Tax=unclassified Thermoplasma TaxID=2684908 RepID=UPI000D8D85E0|nr:MULTISPECIES: hypothetical protein [unclassified Thermoplasma]PYB68904.1 hypothetical protein DMB44_01560 [Thermoplasma sp. Kam2015]